MLLWKWIVLHYLVYYQSYLQVEELIKNWVQSFELHLCALTPGVREEVVRTKLHYDEWIT